MSMAEVEREAIRLITEGVALLDSLSPDDTDGMELLFTAARQSLVAAHDVDLWLEFTDLVTRALMTAQDGLADAGEQS